MRRLATRLWHAWSDLTSPIGDFQARLVLTLVYFTCLAPFTLAVTLFGDPLEARDAQRSTAWVKRSVPPRDMQALRRQI